MITIYKVLRNFLAVRSFQYLLIFLAPNAQFDNSTELLLRKYCTTDEINKFWHRNLLNKLLSWDSVFFLKTALEGKPEFEHEYAFSIVWAKIIRFFSNDSKDLYHLLTIALVLENILFVLSLILLFMLTRITFSKQNRAKTAYGDDIAYKTATLFIINSGSGFLTSIYSEPLSFFFAFLGILAREFAIKVTIPYDIEFPLSSLPLYVLGTAISFSIATLNRSNCILLGIFYLYDLYYILRKRNIKKALLFPVLSGCIMLIIFIIQQYYVPYHQFCPGRGEWCNTTVSKFCGLSFLTKKSFYSFIQSKYWNLGFMKYWTLNNIPNFLFGLPTYIVLFYSTVYFTKMYPNPKLFPLVLVTRSFLVIMLLFAHVQIVNRVSTFIPLHLWYISDRMNKITNSRKKEDDDLIIKFYLYWLILWFPIQTLLFAFFLPPA
ncbi:GPI-anchor transamidase GPI18 [Nakaseomyces bracarensis]|uniref:GPI-anchor transamidase GPI18 n=1 Tax=Nakaseomyces bracarensis TaxID=273131 RepID=UPI003871AB14